jgi:hypothetical protein
MAFMQGPGRFWPSAGRRDCCYDEIWGRWAKRVFKTILEERAMRLTIEIAAAALLLFCISATSAAFAAGKAARSADGLSCSFSVAKNASPAARCAAIRGQCGGKFYANYCGDKMLSAM